MSVILDRSVIRSNDTAAYAGPSIVRDPSDTDRSNKAPRSIGRRIAARHSYNMPSYKTPVAMGCLFVVANLFELAVVSIPYPVNA